MSLFHRFIYETEIKLRKKHIKKRDPKTILDTFINIHVNVLIKFCRNILLFVAQNRNKHE